MTEPQEQKAEKTVVAYDAALYRLAQVPESAMAAEPERYQPVASQKTIMVSRDGKQQPVPADYAQRALNQGWSFLPHDQAASEKRIDFYKDRYDSALAVGAHSNVNHLLMGAPDAADEHRQSAEEREGYRRAEEKHPFAHYLGAGLGIAENIALTGGLGRASGLADGARIGAQALEHAAPGLGARVGQAVARGAAEGALYSAPQAVTHLAYGDPKAASEAVLWGVGTGGALGLGFGAFTHGVESIQGLARAKAIEHGIIDETTGLTNNNGIRKALGLGEELAPEFQGKSVAELAAMRDAAQAQVLEHGPSLDKAAGLRDIVFWDPHNAFSGAKRVGVVPSELAAKIQSEVLETRPGLYAGGFEAERAELEHAVSRIAKGGSDPVSFARLDKLAGPGMTEHLSGLPPEAGPVKIGKQIADIVDREKTKAMNEAYASLGLKDHFGSYMASKEQLQKVGQALQMASMQGAVNPAAQKMANMGTGLIAKGIGGAGASAVSHMLGPVGAFAYPALKGIAKKALDHAIGNQVLQLSTGALSRIANNPETVSWIGPALAKDSMAAVAQKISTVRSALTNASTRAVQADPVKHLLGHQANGLSKDQQYAAVTRQLQATANDTEKLNRETEAFGHLFHKDPVLQANVVQGEQARIRYLAQAVPQPPAPKPFDKSKPEVSAADKKAFLAKLEVSNNPWSVMDHVASGTLTKAHVEALATLYPSLHQKMVQEVARMAHDPSAPSVSPGVKAGLTMMTGVNLTNFSGTNYQTAYQGPNQAGVTPPKKSKGGGSSRAHMTDVPSLATSQSRLEFKGQKVM